MHGHYHVIRTSQEDQLTQHLRRLVQPRDWGVNNIRLLYQTGFVLVPGVSPYLGMRWED